MLGLAFESATSLATKIRRKEFSCVELLRMYLDRVDQHNGELNAIVVEKRDQSLREAYAADAVVSRGDSLGPLHGVPMTIKESCDVAGMPTTWGVPHLRDNIAKTDALAVRRLRQSGVILFGKTNVSFLLSDFQSYNDLYGTTNNPWDLTRSPGGSSGGSAAALAAGLTGIESGSDIGGSLRNPAHYSGVFAHKPTWNLLPSQGHALPGVKGASDLFVIGPLARSAEDLDTAVRVMGGPNEIESRGLRLQLPELNKQLSDLRVAVWRDDKLAPVDNEVSERVDMVAEALKSAGASINYDARPSFTARHNQEVYQFLLHATMSFGMTESQYQRALESAAQLDENDKSYRAMLRRAQVARFRDWADNNDKRTHIRWAWHEFFSDYDILITPIMATPAIKHDHRPMSERSIEVNNEKQDYFLQIFWSGLTTNAYLPSTIVPTGPNRDGLPIGVQIAGPEYGDLITIGVAKELEKQGFAFVAPPNYQ